MKEQLARVTHTSRARGCTKTREHANAIASAMFFFLFFFADAERRHVCDYDGGRGGSSVFPARERERKRWIFGSSPRPPPPRSTFSIARHSRTGGRTRVEHMLVNVVDIDARCGWAWLIVGALRATLSYGLPYRPRSISAVTNYLSNAIDPHPSLRRDDTAGFYIKRAVVEARLCSPRCNREMLEEERKTCDASRAEIFNTPRSPHRNSLKLILLFIGVKRRRPKRENYFP